MKSSKVKILTLIYVYSYTTKCCGRTLKYCLNIIQQTINLTFTNQPCNFSYPNKQWKRTFISYTTRNERVPILAGPDDSISRWFAIKLAIITTNRIKDIWPKTKNTIYLRTWYDCVWLRKDFNAFCVEIAKYSWN